VLGAETSRLRSSAPPRSSVGLAPEILRYLVQRQPFMLSPRWVKTEIQPIGVGNVLNYLVACLAEPQTVGQTLDIGGPDVVSYVDLLQIMAEELGLRRRFILPLPVNARRFSAWWISMITPVSQEMVRLADGLTSRVVVMARSDGAMPQRLPVRGYPIRPHQTHQRG
jgi:uncharacterized protein YbjT (DUF2867 family)